MAEATVVRERPILFSGPMVRAILEGRKTQTRRVVKPGPGPQARWLSPDPLNKAPAAQIAAAMGEFGAQFDHPRGGPLTWVRCPYGAHGDRLWVREAMYIDLMPYDRDLLPKARPAELQQDAIYYRADGECCDQIPECSCGEVGPPRWRPSIHMPRWACRLVLEVESVRVERLQDISEADAQAEGVGPEFELDIGDFVRGGPLPASTYRLGFKHLWNEINASRGYGWDANPWVWAITFRRERVS